ncbi:Multiple resistance and pH homeostasis protein G [[Eubacterium] contortum]|uniref:Multiple resistance and pH homeostasis protein G n=2 Tax=Bacillota TaxID=1239 RepID=A0A174DWS0_9FIRM|nr:MULTISPECIES: monovalent cation/H(+) antiporter subunit G [Clostridia]CUO30011.1 Multiple resistance and pH homeostasis protein G [[Eubacterium] contortum] [Faecalicatena contorta]
MMVLEWIRFLAGAVCMAAGLVFYIIQFIGVFRFKYVLNRMHAAAIGDTLGCGLMLLGAVVFNGFTFPSVKILFLIVFLWMTSPVAAHMVVKLEVLSREKMEDCCPVEAAEELEECCPSEAGEAVEEGCLSETAGDKKTCCPPEQVEEIKEGEA